MNMKKRIALILAAALLLPMLFACAPEEPVTETTTAAPDDGTTTTVPEDDGTTTTLPEDDGTTTTVPEDDGTTTTVPEDDGTTTTVPEDDGTTTTLPEDDGTTTTLPEDDGTTTTAPEDDGTTTTVPEDNNLEIDIDNHPDHTYSGSADCNVLTLNGTKPVISLGEIDLSKYKLVKIYYGGDASIESAGAPIGLLNSSSLAATNPASAANVLARGEMVDIAGRNPEQYGTDVDLRYVNYSGEVFLTIFASTRHDVQIYSIEFIAWEEGETPPALETYTVIFAMDDGTPLQTTEYPRGSFPEYVGETPTKEGLIFAGWTPAIEAVTGDVTYTATFNGARYEDYTYPIVAGAKPEFRAPGTAGCPWISLGGIAADDSNVTENELLGYSVSLGVMDLSKYKSVVICYGGATNVDTVGTPIALTSKEGRLGKDQNTYDSNLENILAEALMNTQIATQYTNGATYVTIDLSYTDYNGEIFLSTTRQMGNRVLQIYSLEFIAWKEGETLVTHTVTFKDYNGDELFQKIAAQGATVPAPTADWLGKANRTATAWKDEDGNLYFWNNHSKYDDTDVVKGWVDANGDAVDLTVTGDMTLTAWSTVVDLSTLEGSGTRPDGTPQLGAFQTTTYDIGAWDLSKYSAVKITYGSGASAGNFPGKYVLLLADTDKEGTPVASAEMVAIYVNYSDGPATVTLDLSEADETYENLYLACTMESNHATGCYRIEFVYAVPAADTTPEA